MSRQTIKKLSKVKSDFDIDLFMRSRKTEIKMSHCESLHERIYDIIKIVKVPMLVMFGQKNVTVSKNILARIKKCSELRFECVDGFIKKIWVDLAL